ncbi:uncharacterized protein H6S33_000784 [Morchella sextelata]|uniref:uncharacterized protein n=1 Tax=Morchella sextelata TaxID=1174677 RepID=UPI001D04DA15|nr:uncharacterized protein H6S33_000784 [Morchella sextelata]KAH0615148.1 hypothetical protein H6S33_000784 [Morchella sextelata]
MGASIWLCPPEGTQIEAILIKLISNTVPAYFGDEKVPDFRPHATITSEIPPNLDPQEVLDSIDIKELPNVIFTSMVIGETFFTRGTLHIEKNDSIVALATHCREKFAFGGQSKEDAEKWAREKFTPHVSLVYSNLWPVPEDVSKAIENDVLSAGVGLSGVSGSNSEPDMNGWKGGKLVLVPTGKPLDEWIVLAERNL